MGEKLDYLKSGLKKGLEIGSNEELSVPEAFNEYGRLVKSEVEATKDLAQARKLRITAVAQRLKTLREESGEKQKTFESSS